LNIKKRPNGLGLGANPRPEFYIGVKVRLIGGEYRGKKVKVLKMKKKKAIVLLDHNEKQAEVLVKHMRRMRNQEDDLPIPSKKKKED